MDKDDYATARAPASTPSRNSGKVTQSHGMPASHRGHWDRLGAGHRQHGAFALGGRTGAKPKPQLTITTEVMLCPSSKGAARIPEQLGVNGVRLMQPGATDQATGIDLPSASSRRRYGWMPAIWLF